MDERGRFLTAREHPQLLKIQSQVSQSGLILNAPAMPTFELPLPLAGTTQRLQITIWRDCLEVASAPAGASEWCSQYLGLQCRLVYMDDQCERSTDPAYSLNHDIVSFADGFPCLLISEASLEDLNKRTPLPISMRRFRPNLVISGCTAYAEDEWQRVRIGEVEFAVVKPCGRCVLTTIDPNTAQPHPQREPLHSLSEYRRGKDRGIYFGQNLIPRKLGTLRVDDVVEII